MTTENKPDYKQNFLHVASLGLGLLSIWPYIVLPFAKPLMVEGLPSIIGAFMGVAMLIIAPFNGVPFGFAGIITGIIALVKTVPTKQKTLVIAMAILGILISLAGCISNIWYFSNLTPWNSVPTH
jgi:hypothetical protein